MAQKLQGKSAVVTGGGGGIGREVALALAAEGAKVVVNDISRETDGTNVADKVVEEITKANGTAVASYDSVTTMLGGENIIKTATSNFGRIDILVCCAGNPGRARTILEMTEEDWNFTVDIHLKGHFTCAKPAAIEMARQKSGRIITFSSRAAFLSAPVKLLEYGTAKAGIMGFTTLLAAELKEYGITVNSILPSAATKGFPGPRPRFGGGMTEEPHFVAPIVVYLATEEAKDITGQFIYSCAGDLCIYARPLQLPGPHTFIRKVGKWTVDELGEIVPPLIVPQVVLPR